MANNLEKFGVIILAAGKGKRMSPHQIWCGDMQEQRPLPKALYPLAGKPIVSYLLQALEKSNLQTKPIIVIAPDLEIIPQTFSNEKYEYALQKEQLGTGHAVLSAKDKMQQFENIIVFNGDHPFVSENSINKLIEKHLEKNSVLTLATAKLPDFEEWRTEFFNFGRIVRGVDGKILRIVEMKDALPEELKITEINPAYYCFKADWLWKNLPHLHSDNAQKEYYLTDLVGRAIEQGEKIFSIELENHFEALGINTPEQLFLAEKLITKIKRDYSDINVIHNNH